VLRIGQPVDALENLTAMVPFIDIYNLAFVGDVKQGFLVK